MHWDPTYDGSTVAESCHDVDSEQQLGIYGSYKCDSSWKLINESVHRMKEIEGIPDFIIWTGHV